MMTSAITCSNLTCPFSAQCQESTIEGQNATCVCPTSSSCNTDTIQVVCGDNGETYPSRCQLQVFACKEQRNIMVQNEGACESKFIKTIWSKDIFEVLAVLEIYCIICNVTNKNIIVFINPQRK